MTYLGENSLGYSLVSETEDGTKYLVGSRCTKCGDVRIPARALCGNDLAVCEPFEFSGNGEVYEAVRMSLAPQGFEAPFWVGYVDLDEGVRFFAQIASADGDSDPAHGDRVAMHIEAIGAGADAIYGPVFRRVLSNAVN